MILTISVRGCDYSMILQEKKKTRKGGRSAGRASPINATIVHHPALISKIPIYEVANQEGVDQIHELAMRIVEEIGVEFRDAKSLEI